MSNPAFPTLDAMTQKHLSEAVLPSTLGVAASRHSHYKKDVSHLSMVDVYRVLELFDVTHPAVQHAIKKLLVAGNRGSKEWEQDVREAVDSCNRALQMKAEDCNASAQMYGVQS